MEEIWLIFATQCTKHGRLRPGALSTAERSYPTSEIRGSGRECQAMMRRNGREPLGLQELCGPAQWTINWACGQLTLQELSGTT